MVVQVLLEVVVVAFPAIVTKNYIRNSIQMNKVRKC